MIDYELIKNKFKHSDKKTKQYTFECLETIKSLKNDEVKIKMLIRSSIDTLQNEWKTICAKYGTTEYATETNKKLQVWTAISVLGWRR